MTVSRHQPSMLCDMLTSSPTQFNTVAPPVLLSVRNVHEEIAAGLGRARCIVRTLDGLSCDICAGELVILQGGVASGASSLLDVFAGMRTRARGMRYVAEKVRVRRGAIGADAARSIIAGWSDQYTRPHRQQQRAETPIAYLFRVRARSSTTTANLDARHQAWRTWAAALYQRHGTIVLSVQQSREETTQRADIVGALREPTVVRERNLRQPRADVRILTLVAGKIVTASVDSSVLHASGPYSTTSPQP